MNENRISYKTMFWFSGAILAIMFALAAWAWMQLPADAELPVHWNAAGEADRFGGKFEGLLFMPLVALAMVLVLAVVPKIAPKGKNIEQSGKAYMVVWGGTLLLLFVTYISGLADTFKWFTLPMGATVNTALGLLFIVMGNYMGKIRYNYMFGVRTPWTLASEHSWNKTHRIGGRLWVVVGVLIVLSTWLIGGEISAYIQTVGILGSFVFVLIYSYFVWKNDPTLEAQ